MNENPNRQNSDKYCRFHRDREHTTEKCHHHKIEIEKLIRWGYLKEFGDQRGSLIAHKGLEPSLTQAQTRENDKGKARDHDNLHAGVIVVILGGLVGGDSSNARKLLLQVARGVNAGLDTPGSKVFQVDKSQQEIPFID